MQSKSGKLSAWAILGAGLSCLIGAAQADSLYVADRGDNTVKKFDATTGAYLGTFIEGGLQGIHGPAGLIFTKGRLLVVNQNVNMPYAGEILRFNPGTGAYASALKGCNPPLRTCSSDAPFAPRGISRGPGYTAYVADWKNSATSGRIAQYDLNSGALIRNLDTSGYNGPFFPTAIVRGPDDLLYVTSTGDPDLAGNTSPGAILRFNAVTGRFVDILTTNAALGCSSELHSPNALTFGPNGLLYVATGDFNNPLATGKILVFNAKTKACLESISLGTGGPFNPGASRGFAPSIIFGPNNRMFVPDVDTGQIRAYNLTTKTFSNFISAGGVLLNPWYLSFGLTDPESLEYLN